MKRLFSVLCVLAFVGAAWAGSTPDKMAAMKAEMSKCAVCKHLAAKMDAIGPMSQEVVHLDNGAAFVNTVKNPANVPVLHATCDEMHTAGMACMKMTDAEAKTQLCPFCQGIRAAAMKGATISHGETKTGSMMVLASSDPAVQKDIAAVASKCEMMHEQMQQSAR